MNNKRLPPMQQLEGGSLNQFPSLCF